MLNVIMPNVIMLNITSAECHIKPFLLNVIMLSDIPAVCHK
jgi:hypothetical protein